MNLKKLFIFFIRFKDGKTRKDKLIIFLHNMLYLFLYPVNHLLFGILKRNLIHPKIFFKQFSVKNSDGIFICRDNVDHDIVSEEFESGIRKYFKDFKGRVFVDIGANIGKYTIIVGNLLNDNGTIVSIEPHPDNFRVLEENIKLNNCKNIIPLNLACWSKWGILKLYNHEDQPVLASAIKKSKNFVTVKANTLDNILKNLKIKNVDMIKLDVEGAEPEVMKGMTNILKTKKPSIIFEAWNNDTVNSCKKILGKNDYDVNHLTEMYWIGSYKGS